MKPTRFFLAVVVLGASVRLAPAQNYAPPPSKPPAEATLKAIADKTGRLGSLLSALRRRPEIRDPHLSDVEIYHKAALWIARHNEFYQAEAGDWTLDALDRGIARARQLGQNEGAWYRRTGQTVVHGHRSRIDGSVQPYAVTLPADYGKNPNKKWRLDVVLHGRDPSLTEIKFLHQHGDREAPKDLVFVQLDIYGRGNNAYRWAGETDVIEVVDHFLATERMLQRESLIDLSRVVLRGFSMGGAGTWHIGLHSPSRWCLLGPGAGFTTTHGYIKDLADPLPPYQEACLHVYDAIDYAENAFDVPVVAYAGEKDPQLQAARNIEAKLKPLGISMNLLVAPGLGHSFPPEWRKRAEEAYAPYVAKGKEEYPPKLRFVTYTLRYPSCAWVEILSFDRSYERARVEAELNEGGYTIKTANVRALHLTLSPNVSSPVSVKIDGQTLSPRPYQSLINVTSHLYLERKEGQWASVLPQKLFTDRQRRQQKTAGLQGPIDDAFMDAFLCVRGTGTPWNEALGKYADENLKRFEEEWDKYLRGSLPVKRDDEVTEEDITAKHLILFGDPASNSLIGQVLDGLPLKWTKEQIVLGKKIYAAQEHVPVLIFPSPLNTARYVVLNSGHTFHAADFLGTNALLYPRLGDYAILKPTPTDKDLLAAEVVTAGLFDDYWRP